MAQLLRKAQPDCLRYFLKILHVQDNDMNDGRADTASIDQLVEVLVNVGKYSKALAKETVANAICDGLLVPVPNRASKAPRNVSVAAAEQTKRVRLPLLQEIKSSSHDFYCYECHLPGLLEPCRQCTRSFHRLCYRKNPERPNYVVPSSKIQKNPLPTFSSASESDSDENDTVRCSTAVDYDSDVRASSAVIRRDQTSLNTSADINNDASLVWGKKMSGPLAGSFESSNNNNNMNQMPEDKPVLEKLEESKTIMDVVYLGEVRPPQRKRPTPTTASCISYKSEILPTEEDETDLELCTCCRLLKSADLRNPPNVQADELCFLINYTFIRNKDWIYHDVAAYLEKWNTSTKETNIISRLLFVPSLKRLSDIADNIRRQAYGLLMEFLVDLLDIQHSIGVFFGPNSTEIESTKWLLRDVAYDLSEIRRCHDCFRYSHETASSVWFAKPCVQRHELVFAKHSSFPYWPAKVIRVLPNNKYDVRFFGGNHSRALIDVRFIKAIDSDPRSLKLGKSAAMKKALEELHHHQMLSTYPPSKFGFHANPEETEKIIRTVLNNMTSTEVMGHRSIRGRRPKRKQPDSRTNVTVSTCDSTLIMPQQCFSLDNSLINNNNNNNNSIANVDHGIAILNNNNSKSNNTGIGRPIVCLKRLKFTQLTGDGTGGSSSGVNGGGDEIIQHRNTRKKARQAISPDDTAETINVMLKQLDEARKTLKEYKLKVEKLEAQNLRQKEAIKKHEVERRILKRKQWCYWCLEEAIYLCCFRASYCSEICQKRDWRDGHSAVCKNQNAIATNEKGAT